MVRNALPHSLRLFRERSRIPAACGQTLANVPMAEPFNSGGALNVKNRTWMSRWKLGSMVNGSMGYDSPTYKWGIPWGYNPLILTFDLLTSWDFLVGFVFFLAFKIIITIT